ncbi:DUF6059 family protein [Kitasatospora sp. NPDC059571]|uniref:DUF6059 family protein n=1 Tax=Kitasatospora sp. NPDC059571 TaxID=3346871 RepID=UPI0036C9B171
MHRMLLCALRSVAYPAGRALALYGQVFAPLVPPQYLLRPAAAAPVRWDGPPPGHPERLRPDLPPTAAERELFDRLGLTARPGRG